MKLNDNLPPDLARHRHIGTAEAAALCNISVPHFRRLYSDGRFPKPVRLGSRKLGWQVGTVLDWMEARQAGSVQ